MDTFASIALSTTLRWPAKNKRSPPSTPPSQHLRALSETLQRPAKRPRSEKLASPERSQRQSDVALRPVTSYDNVAKSRMMEAELLLNFSQVARLSAPSTMSSYKSYGSGIYYSSSIPNQVEVPSAQTSSQNVQKYPVLHGIESQPGQKGPPTRQEFPGATGGVPESPNNIPATNSRRTSISDVPPLDFREQLIEASKSAEHHFSPSGAARSITSVTTYHQPLQLERGQQLQRDDQLATEDIHIHDASAVQHSEVAGTKLEDPLEAATDRPSHEDGFSPCGTREDRVQHSPITQEQTFPVNGYWPSMLATTVEQSASAWKNRLTLALEELGTEIHQSKPGTGSQSTSSTTSAKGVHAQEPATCAACKFMRNSMSVEADGESASWISCDGCKSWFHFACAGFKSEREVRAVDKYRCRSCKAIHGPTTYVRKSARAHTAIDYAGLNQGVVKTSDERPEHHYIKPIKEGTINLQPENFARIRPELVTAEYFEKGNGMKEPVVIPAALNPRPKPLGSFESSSGMQSGNTYRDGNDAGFLEDWFPGDPESRNVPDHGQDALDMVIPPNLTVRTVAELYGPEEKVEVIDVKSQNGEGKKWNMRRWADYYENTSNKVVRNVISLEVSRSTLGRLIRRPQIVRDLDLQDSVWPADLQAKGEFPRVQFYCLMSVADCFTDFHIDFGGSSVFYHILKGKKTFFFIPPKEKHLKKYEEWCMSPAQNWTFLADQTKECYRVDLSEGDTMLIPAGWIHAVWTPENSLVIGGNFLTRLNYSMQLRIAQVEKATGVARKFRYPHFQKIQWYTAVRYLENDPIPNNVRSELQGGGVFHRQYPVYHDFDAWGENSRSGPENYHARYYSQPELEGLPDLVRYLLRTALIDSGDITEGITAEARNAVRKSIPRGFGEPLEIVKNFAIWCAWKRGNEPIPHWAYPDAVPEIRATDAATKLSAVALKKLDRETTSQPPRRHSSRNHVQQPLNFAKGSQTLHESQGDNSNTLYSSVQGSTDVLDTLAKGSLGLHTTPLKSGNEQHPQISASRSSRKRKTAPGEVVASHRKTACESCRKRRRACKHKTDQQPQNQATLQFAPNTGDNQQVSTAPPKAPEDIPSEAYADQLVNGQGNLNGANREPERRQQAQPPGDKESSNQPQPSAETAIEPGPADGTVQGPPQAVRHDLSPPDLADERTQPRSQTVPSRKHLTSPQSKGRNKACNDCRKSKVSDIAPVIPHDVGLSRLQRRCVHDENGNEDPVKIREAATPRSAGANKRRKIEHDTQGTVETQRLPKASGPNGVFHSKYLPGPGSFPVHKEVRQPAHAAVMVAEESPADVTMNDDSASSTGMDQSPAPGPVNDAIEATQSQPFISISQTGATNSTHPSTLTRHTSEVSVNTQNPIGLPEPQTITTTTPSKPAKYDFPTQPGSNATFEQPAAASLVSPPASSHDESEQGIAPTNQAKPTSSASSSRHSSHHPTQQTPQNRFTPESGPARRASSGSVVVGHTSPAEADKLTSTSPTSVHKRIKMRTDSEAEADGESLRLIKALQAEEYGLRRRGRV
ncbi:MAG: hypothetical protein LQ338_003073 [Usnochroma carphineum]|nr:MAG: hypothetical protein LQ338_003073 [Usnochroma carphineum]